MSMLPVILHLVVASPSDVQAEREIIPSIIEEANRWFGAPLGFHIEVGRWETDAYPGFHPEGPQGLIDGVLHIEDADIFIGIFWKRFGTPVKDGTTGTEHEFLKAYEVWKLRGRPQVMMYFKRKAHSPESKEETDQWGKVLDFKRRFPAEGLWWPYESKTDFERLFRNHLLNLLRDRYLSRFVGISSEESPAMRQLQLLPPAPSLLIGREEGLDRARKCLGIGSDSAYQGEKSAIAVMRGWPGVGKSSLAAALVYDIEVRSKYPDGVLWVSLGQNPNLFSALTTWGQVLGSDEFLKAPTQRDATALLKKLLNNKQMLLVVDDIWETEHAVPYLHIRGNQCSLLFTTRETAVAVALAPSESAIYNVPVLSIESAVELLRFLAPSVVMEYETDCRTLMGDLECLPLAIHVAGRTLNVEAKLGWTVKDLLSELRSGSAIVQSTAPADRADVETQTIPTVAALFRQSTDRLKPICRKRFAYLGPFAPKPAAFDLDALKAVWKTDDPKPCVRELVSRGLMEPIEGRFQVHALLIAHALSLPDISTPPRNALEN